MKKMIVVVGVSVLAISAVVGIASIPIHPPVVSESENQIPIHPPVVFDHQQIPIHPPVI